MDPNNFHINPQFNQQPEKPKSGKAKWFIIGGAVLLFVGGIVFFAIKIGKNMGEKFGNLASTEMYKQDSINVQNNNESYHRLDSMIAEKSSAAVYKAKIDSLKEKTNRIISTFDEYKKGFRDTLTATKAMAFDTRVSNQYFIKTGRAHELKINLTKYRNNSVADMEDQANAETYKMMLMIDEMSKSMPGMLKKLMDWENLYFNQPPQTVMTNTTLLKTEVRSFEAALLAFYEAQIKMLPDAPVNDSVADSVM